VTRVALALARRSVLNAARRPQFLAPLVLFPSLFLAVNVGGLTRTTDLPGFPQVDGFLDFQLAAAMTQSLLLGGVATGIAVALEIEGGFFDRLVTAPIPRAAILVGRLAGAGAIAVAQVAWFLVIGLLFGASIQAGPLGVLSVVAIGIVAGTGFAAIGILLALRARNASTVQGIFPLVFVVLFVSSAFFPENLLSSPADTIAAYNPLSYVAEGMREPIAYGTDVVPVLEGLAAAAGITAAAVAACLASLRGRLGEA
jgi:ABC-2 type transport system permease protein